MEKFCRVCGSLCVVDDFGVSNHVYESGEVHHVLDGDHVAIPELEDTLINEEVFDFCKDHYECFNAYPMECELSNGSVILFDEMMQVLSAEQKQEIEK